MDAQKVVFYPPGNVSLPEDPPSIHILSGSFRSLSLFLLAFSPTQRTLSHLQTVEAYGPHQYLATNALKNRVYTTSWALPPSLSSWRVERSEVGPWRVEHVNTVPITATSSYISIPPPYTHAYSVGGPTGESHRVDGVTGALKEKVQQVLFVPEDQLEEADKTRKALRYGSHAIEFTPSGRYALVPVLGTNSIEMYACDSVGGRLSHITSIPSSRGHQANDGPRHLKIHPNGKILYSVTEHSNFVDVYRILPETLEYVNSRSLLPKPKYLPDPSSTGTGAHFRGDTLMFPPSTSSSPIPRVLITTTRGSTSEVRGWLSIFPLDEDGNLVNTSKKTNGVDVDGASASVADDDEAERFQTPTSGGKANAIDVISKLNTISNDHDQPQGLWILLTDDDDATASRSGTGAVRVLEWDGWGTGGVKIVAEWPAGSGPGSEEDPPSANWGEDSGEDGIGIRGASHAIWLD